MVALVSSIPWGGAQLNAGLAVKNRLLTLCEFNNANLKFFHLDNPFVPVPFRDCSVGAGPRHVLFIGDRWAVVACRNGNLIQVIDYSNLASPTVVQSLTCAGGPNWLCTGDAGFIHAACVDSNQIKKYAVSAIAPFLTDVGSPLSVSNGPLSVASNGAGLLASVGISGNLDIMSATSMAAVWSVPIDSGTQMAHVEWISVSCCLITDYARGRFYTADVLDPIHATIRTNYIALSVNPSQFILYEDRAFIPSLTPNPVIGGIDVVDVRDAGHANLIGSVQGSVSGAGFAANYKNAGYVSGHFPPFNLDVYDLSP